MKEYTKLRNKNREYMKLDVWQKAMDLYRLVWNIVYRDAKVDYELRSQIADSAQ